MNIRSVKDENFEGKNVLVRVDFNVELDQNDRVAETYKLEAPKETIDHILSFPNAKVALLTHFGRPEGIVVPECSLRHIEHDVARAIGRSVRLASDCIGSGVIESLDCLENGEVLLLENVRFHDGEMKNEIDFSRALTSPFDCYVNEAFSVSHRDQASVTGVPKLLPSYAGIRLLREIEKLSDARDHPKHPAVAIIGGAKIETKLPLIRKFEQEFDAVLVGGKIANEALDQQLAFSGSVLLPQDFQGGDARLDIGPKTTAMYIEIIRRAQTIVWNGPMGKFEEKPYDSGTNAIMEAIATSNGDVVIGGGESLAAAERGNILHKIGFVSTGGGAMLEFMSGSALPGITALEDVA